LYDLNNPKLVQSYGTNLYLTLNEPLLPGSELSFIASWKQKIPSYFNSRTAAYDSSTCFIGYWYPQIAVYDDIFGWDNLNYNIRSEFYNNLGNYDVKIEVPENYIVWATGDLQNSNLILPEEIHNKYLQAKSSNKTIQIISDKDLEKGIKTLSNIWHFTASEVTDFAFALSDHYLWDAASLKVNDRNVFLSAAYPLKRIENCSELVAIQQKAMKHMSGDIPGIPYPYETFTTVITKGSGGMEFPMMANNGQHDIPLTIHEMFHTYFPMYVRINESRWSWMDEGWAVYNTRQLTNRLYKNKFDISDNFSFEYGLMQIGTFYDLPIIISTEFLTGFNHTYCSYSKPALVYAILHHHLGEQLFLKCYREYIQRWAKKSPSPYDFFYTFENISKQDLSWLWKPWFFEFGVADIAIEAFKQEKLTILNKGDYPVPLFVEIKYENGDMKTIDKSAEIWKDGKNKIEISIPEYENVELILVNSMIADDNIVDNVYPGINSIYKGFDISPDILGEYQMDRYNIGFSIIQKDEMYYINVPGVGISQLIYPINCTHFKSLNRSLDIKIIKDKSEIVKGLDLNLVGLNGNCKKLN
ncbi:MAG: M1 family aminopeptidase, partial [Bacteroidales bacterium]